MLTITEDPGIVIPNIREDSIETSIVILVLYEGSNAHVGAAVRTLDDIYCWYGGSITGRTTEEWSECTNHNLIDLLCHSWEYYYPDKCIYVITSYKELNTIISQYSIRNVKLLETLQDVAYGRFADYMED